MHAYVYLLWLAATTQAAPRHSIPEILGRPAKRQIAPPVGESTADIPRPQVGDVPYGVTLTQCIDPKMIALTFDDGPYIYTSSLLDLLDRYNVKATFFINGRNLIPSGIDDCSTPYPSILRRMSSSAHHIASHTYTHPYLSPLSQSDFEANIIDNEMTLRNILGFFPTYLRPPYLDCDAQCLSRLSTLGYHVISTSLDTKDYENDDPTLIVNAQNTFRSALDAGAQGPIVLAHDVHANTVSGLAEFMITTAQSRGYRLVTVGECLGDPAVNWYRAGGGSTICDGAQPSTVSSATSAPTGGQGVSTDAQCGSGVDGLTCAGSAFGNCCSQWGWCGSTVDYCGAGCQGGFGTCE